MANLIADFFPLAIGVAFSSAPVIALILILFGRHARRNGPAFMFGWMAGIGVVGGLALLLANAGRISAGGGSLRLAYSIQFLFGLALLILAFRGWQQRARRGDAQELPDWMTSLDGFSTRRIFWLGVTLADANLKNLFLTIAAAMMISEAHLSNIQSWFALAVFVGLSSITIIAPVIYFLLAQESAEEKLSGWKSWLVNNNTNIQILLCLVFGIILSVTGFRGLIS